MKNLFNSKEKDKKIKESPKKDKSKEQDPDKWLEEKLKSIPEPTPKEVTKKDMDQELYEWGR